MTHTNFGEMPVFSRRTSSSAWTPNLDAIEMVGIAPEQCWSGYGVVIAPSCRIIEKLSASVLASTHLPPATR